MLVLSRQRDETIMIGDSIEVTVVDIRGDKVRLGINAPTTVAVHRKEIYEAIRCENQEAARLGHASPETLSVVAAQKPSRTDQRPAGASLISNAVEGMKSKSA